MGKLRFPKSADDVTNFRLLSMQNTLVVFGANAPGAEHDFELHQKLGVAWQRKLGNCGFSPEIDPADLARSETHLTRRQLQPIVDEAEQCLAGGACQEALSRVRLSVLAARLLFQCLLPREEWNQADFKRLCGEVIKPPKVSAVPASGRMTDRRKRKGSASSSNKGGKDSDRSALDAKYAAARGDFKGNGTSKAKTKEGIARDTGPTDETKEPCNGHEVASDTESELLLRRVADLEQRLADAEKSLERANQKSAELEALLRELREEQVMNRASEASKADIGTLLQRIESLEFAANRDLKVFENGGLNTAAGEEEVRLDGDGPNCRSFEELMEECWRRKHSRVFRFELKDMLAIFARPLNLSVDELKTFGSRAKLKRTLPPERLEAVLTRLDYCGTNNEAARLIEGLYAE